MHGRQRVRLDWHLQARLWPGLHDGVSVRFRRFSRVRFTAEFSELKSSFATTVCSRGKCCSAACGPCTTCDGTGNFRTFRPSMLLTFAKQTTKYPRRVRSDMRVDNRLPSDDGRLRWYSAFVTCSPVFFSAASDSRRRRCSRRQHARHDRLFECVGGLCGQRLHAVQRRRDSLVSADEIRRRTRSMFVNFASRLSFRRVCMCVISKLTCPLATTTK